MVGNMRLDVCVRKCSKLDSVAADVTKNAAFNQIVTSAALKIQSSGRKILKNTVLEGNMSRIFVQNRGARPANPGDVVQFGMIACAARRKFARIEHEHPILQRNVALFGWPKP